MAPVAITCAGKPSPIAERLVEERREVLLDVAHPVGGEDVLVLPHDRALEAHHRVDPGGEARLDREGGVGAVVGAAVGDAVVDHHDLAVVAHVDAALERARQQEADRERHGEPHAGLGHALPVLGADHGAGAEIVGHGAAGDAAGGGALQRLDHLEAVGVGEPDVEADVDMALGGVDVGDDVVDDVVAVAEEPPAVAADRGEAGDRLADAEERQVGRAARPPPRPRPRGCRSRRRRAGAPWRA